MAMSAFLKSHYNSPKQVNDRYGPSATTRLAEEAVRLAAPPHVCSEPKVAGAVGSKYVGFTFVDFMIASE
ncbi:hypothetical protein SAMN04488105_1364 [Salipiger thiooxidans]|uniref:Uncharacterized protein n=1 Tax=Salipiger thiooxidans TaxID=282683 RepID=A0A1G7MI72_9RHOB|nr:hypothetical protein SAMN04488105_1364 [Salipiger thiooxidans]